MITTAAARRFTEINQLYSTSNELIEELELKNMLSSEQISTENGDDRDHFQNRHHFLLRFFALN